jgi:hypothetical protein
MNTEDFQNKCAATARLIDEKLGIERDGGNE